MFEAIINMGTKDTSAGEGRRKKSGVKGKGILGGWGNTKHL